jgi:hypothetical protein
VDERRRLRVVAAATVEAEALPKAVAVADISVP